jgi:hypothetical protein
MEVVIKLVASSKILLILSFVNIIQIIQKIKQGHKHLSNHLTHTLIHTKHYALTI